MLVYILETAYKRGSNRVLPYPFVMGALKLQMVITAASGTPLTFSWPNIDCVGFYNGTRFNLQGIHLENTAVKVQKVHCFLRQTRSCQKFSNKTEKLLI